MFCSKCGTQLNEGTPVCTNCGCPTEYYNKTNTIMGNEKVFQKVGLVVVSIGFNLLFYLILLLTNNSMITYSTAIDSIINISSIISSVLVFIFCFSNQKIIFNKANSILMIIGISSLLMAGVTLLWWIDYNTGFLANTNIEDIYSVITAAYSLFTIIIFVGLVILLFSIEKFICMTEIQKVLRIIGISTSIIYIFWILAVSFPIWVMETTMPEIITNIYVFFVVPIIGCIMYLVIISVFINNKKLS